MYVVNQKATLCIKFCFFIGMPLLSSFILPGLANYRFLSVALTATAYILGRYYPDKIEIQSDRIRIKLFLLKDWIDIPLEDLRIERKVRYLVLVGQERVRYCLSLEKLSIRLYDQLMPFMEDK